MRYIRNLLIPVGVLILWEVAGRTGMSADYLSYPSEIALALAELAASGELVEHFLSSALRAYGGYIIGATGGVLLGILSGIFAPVRSFFEPLVSLFYPIPKIAFLPIIILWLGIGHGSKIMIIAVSVSFPTFIAAMLAAMSVDRIHLWSARNMGASRARIIFRVVLPAALPQIFSGLRIGLALAFIVLFAAEMAGARSGLGYLITEAEEGVRFDMMFAGIFAIAVVGFASDRVLLWARRRLLKGQIIQAREVEV